MSEVSCKIVKSHFDFLRSRDLSVDTFLQELQNLAPSNPDLQATKLNELRERISWSSFVILLNLFGEFLTKHGVLNWEEEFIVESMTPKSSWLPYSVAAKYVTSPNTMYLVVNKFIGPSIFGAQILVDVVQLPNGQLKQTMKIADGYEDCPSFFRLTQHGLAKAPSLLGLKDSLVEMEIYPKRAEFLITPPASKALFSRLMRALTLPFDTMKVLEELSIQDEQFRENYSRLARSEAALQETQRALEARVKERTSELAQANAELKKQIEAILKKEEENKVLNEQLTQLQKIEAIGALAGGISHEINNVLHGIFLSIDLAERNLAIDHPAREKVAMAKKFTLRGQDLMKQVLAFSRKSQIEKRAVPIRQTLHEAVHLMRSTLPRSVHIIVDDSSITDSTAVLSDSTQLQQVLINLGSNAAHAMRERGGVLSIQAKVTSSNEVDINVIDTGEGIDPAIKSRIFEPFFTTKPMGEGTGMGLAVVHGIVTSHSGRITVESEKGRGTRFTLTFPMIELEELEAEVSESDLVGGTEKILVVDDEPELLDVISDTLQTFGYHVISAASADEALKRISETQIDLVLTDYSMPGMSGIELARQVRLRYPDTKIIMCTGYRDVLSGANDTDIVDARVSKPLDAISLNKQIRLCFAN